MTNYLQKLHTQEKINTAIGAVNVVQTAAMNAKLARLTQLQDESNEIQTQIANINLYIAKKQDELIKLSKKNLDEQKKQTKILEIQTNLTKFKIDLDIEERKQEKTIKEKISNMMEVAFQTTEDMMKIRNSNNHKLENFFQIQALLKNCVDAGVATNVIDEIEHKKYIKKCLKSLEEETDRILDGLSEEERKDLDDLIRILSTDEEMIIHGDQKKIKEIKTKVSNFKEKMTLIDQENLKNQDKILKLERLREVAKKELQGKRFSKFYKTKK